MGQHKRKLCIVGSVGLPASYGGFETLVENLVRHHFDVKGPFDITVYCSGKHYSERLDAYCGAKLEYVEMKANGVSSVGYDIVSMVSAIRNGCDVLLILGVSGAIVLPLVKIFSRCKIVTNIDGVEWKRAKWSLAPRLFLRLSEWLAVLFSDKVVSDNGGIAEHVMRSYGKNSVVIAYGGDHAISCEQKDPPALGFDSGYALALCRIEPENNIEMILEAFSQLGKFPLVFVGNWNSSEFGRTLRSKYGRFESIKLVDPIYDLGVLKAVRSKAAMYVHGHSAGGTNPSLVEMMHFGVPVVAFDCVFNRFSTENEAIFFRDSRDLMRIVGDLSALDTERVGASMKKIALERYTWAGVGQAYLDVLSD